MRSNRLPIYALAAAILIVGLVALGMPVGMVFILAILVACPLMMFFMMRGMHGGGTHGGNDRSTIPPAKTTIRSASTITSTLIVMAARRAERSRCWFRHRATPVRAVP